MNKLNNIKKVIIVLLSYLFVKLLFLLFSLISNSIYIVIITSIISFCVYYFLKERKEKKDIVVISVFSLLLSLTLTIQNKISFNGNISSSFQEMTISKFQWVDGIKVAILGVCLFFFIFYVCEKNKKSKFSIVNSEKSFSKKNSFLYWLAFSVAIAIPFLFFLCTYAPGSILADSLNSLSQGLGWIPYSNHQPVVYSVIVGLFMRIGGTFNSYTTGVMLYSIFQTLIISGILGYFLLWMKKQGIKETYIILCYLYFIANTLFACYAITMWKDPLFCAFIFLLTLYLYDIIKSRGEILKTPKGITKFIILDFLIAFFRNNGIYILIGVGIALIFCYRKKILKFQIINMITILCIIIIQGPIYSMLKIDTPMEESLAIPIQQIARTVAYDGEMTKSQREFINTILPIEKWKEDYKPGLVDTIKWDDEINLKYIGENKLEFVKLWFSLMPKNMKHYIDAYLLDTYGFWSIETKNDYGFYSIGVIENKVGINNKDIIKTATGKSLKSIYKNPDFCGSGTLLWIMLTSIMLLIIQRKQIYIIVLTPCILSILSILIATPVAFSLRYVFMLAYCLPVFILLPYMTKNEE